MDTISNFIIKIKNASDAHHESVSVPHSKLKLAISEVLKKEGFIGDYEENANKKLLTISLLAENRIPKIKGIQRISKPSKRIYKKYGEVHSVKNGYGAMIISTSEGIMTGHTAKKKKVGGEALFSIW